MTMPFDRVRERYRNDTTFRCLVDSLQAAVLHMQLTPSEVREAAMLACVMIEERCPPGPVRRVGMHAPLEYYTDERGVERVKP